jgi:hypothetical protein
MSPVEKINSKPRTLKELANVYSVNTKTFRGWLNSESLKHIQPDGYYYSIKQIKEILEHLGEP